MATGYEDIDNLMNQQNNLLNEQQKKQPMLLDCHVVTLARSFLFRKFVRFCQEFFQSFYLLSRTY